MRVSTFVSIVSALVLCASAVPTAELENRSSHGRGTWYEVGLGACGNYNTDDQAVVAVSHYIYDEGAHCGEKVKISYGGVTKTATVVDECMGCASGALDMSPTLFQEFSSLDTGVIEISWYFTSSKKGSSD